VVVIFVADDEDHDHLGIERLAPGAREVVGGVEAKPIDPASERRAVVAADSDCSSPSRRSRMTRIPAAGLPTDVSRTWVLRVLMSDR